MPHEEGQRERGGGERVASAGRPTGEEHARQLEDTYRRDWTVDLALARSLPEGEESGGRDGEETTTTPPICLEVSSPKTSDTYQYR